MASPLPPRAAVLDHRRPAPAATSAVESLDPSSTTTISSTRSTPPASAHEVTAHRSHDGADRRRLVSCGYAHRHAELAARGEALLGRELGVVEGETRTARPDHPMAGGPCRHGPAASAGTPRLAGFAVTVPTSNIYPIIQSG